MIEIYLLEQLSAFHKYGTLSAAAEYLHLAQPSLSRSMQKLEYLLGVKLFERTKNKVQLNETGILAANYANQILDNENEMIRHIRIFDRSFHTISIGSNAPGPLMQILPIASACFTDMTITSNLCDEETLLRGIHDDTYSLIILNHAVEFEDIYCTEYCNEQLYLSVQHFHPAASKKAIAFKEMDGQSFIMHSQVGLWDKLVRKKMPHAKFYLQNDLDAVGELQRSSDLPSFATDISLKMIDSRNNGRIFIPFSDNDAKQTYYLICLKTKYNQIKTLFPTVV
ncbi:MAG: LysR family transcriptional regulator [Anaerostipes sp.]|nr:LysR family transcriptional regulator [Anaerostipes sp.]MDD3745689.1 LysR family transcriptional regulator [Anaerostipes sp.]